jgi:isopentenyldiphosphate isomerase
VSTAPVDEARVDIIDPNGEVTGTASRAEVRRGNLRHRTVFVAVLNTANQVLAHRRADWKDLWPGAWDIAFGGVVEAGEAWETAAARELAEEAGLQAELHYLGEDCYEDDDVREVARVYLVRHDGPVSPVDGEVVETVWVALDDMCGWLDERRVCPDSVALVLPRLDAP